MCHWKIYSKGGIGRKWKFIKKKMIWAQVIGLTERRKGKIYQYGNYQRNLRPLEMRGKGRLQWKNQWDLLTYWIKLAKKKNEIKFLILELEKMFSSVQFSSTAQSCPTLFDLWAALCQASLSITNSQRLLKFMSITSVMPSNHLILYSPDPESLPGE